MTGLRQWLSITLILNCAALTACDGESTSSAMTTDAANPSVDAETAAPPEEDCTDGFNASQGEPLRAFDTLEAGRYCEVLIVYTGDNGAVLADVQSRFEVDISELPDEIDISTYMNT